MGQVKYGGINSSAFNTPFELGLRMVYLLSAMYPLGADLQKLVLLDYAIIYSADFGGPSSLHVPIPMRGNEIFNRRSLIENGIYLMITKGLIFSNYEEDGVVYYAGDNCRAIVDSIDTPYALELIERCEWATSYFKEFDSINLTEKFNELGLRWVAELDSGAVDSGFIWQ